MVIQTPQQEAAFDRALVRARDEKIRIFRLDDGTYGASSTTRPGLVHKVNGHCDCEAGQRNIVCKHFAAVEMHRILSTETCYHCGHTGDDVVASPRQYGVMYWCADAIACGQRYDAKREVI